LLDKKLESLRDNPQCIILPDYMQPNV